MRHVPGRVLDFCCPQIAGRPFSRHRALNERWNPNQPVRKTFVARSSWPFPLMLLSGSRAAPSYVLPLASLISYYKVHQIEVRV